MTPLVLSKIQLSLAVELAAQHAAEQEIASQLHKQMPDRDFSVAGAFVDMQQILWPSIVVDGQEIQWVD